MRQVGTQPGKEAGAGSRALQSALNSPVLVLSSYARRARVRRPHATPAEVLAEVDRRYLSLTTSSGLVTGGAAAVPGVGTAASLTTLGCDITVVTASSFDLALAYAYIYGIPVQDLRHRELLGLLVMGGDGAVNTLQKASGRSGPHLSKELLKKIPARSIRKLNKVLGQHFITKTGQRGVIQLGKVLPFGFGAVIGGGGNYLVGRSVIKTARKLFGPVPATWSDQNPPDDGPAACSPVPVPPPGGDTQALLAA